MLQEVILEELGDLKGDFIGLGQGGFAHQLHDFGQVFLLLQNLLYLGTEWNEIGVVLVVKVVQSTQVFTVAEVPMSNLNN